MFGVRVRKRDGQRVHLALSRCGFLASGFVPLREGEYVIFPLREGVDEHELGRCLLDDVSWVLVDVVFKESSRRHVSLVDLVRDLIPSDLLDLLPSSFDQIGDVIVVDFHPGLAGFEEVIGDALLRVVKRASAVYKKTSGVHGLTRVRGLELVAGVDRDWVVHREYGIVLWVKFKEVYFSPRLSEEHRRVASVVRDGETVVDLFTGVGGFPLHITRLHDSLVFAVDINAAAIESLKRSLEVNKLRGHVVPVCSDSVKWAFTQEEGMADHVIMNHPSASHEFITPAVHLLRSGGILHFYTFAEINRWKEHAQEILVKALTQSFGSRVHVKEVLNLRRVRQYSPSHHHVCLEAVIEKN